MSDSQQNTPPHATDLKDGDTIALLKLQIIKRGQEEDGKELLIEVKGYNTDFIWAICHAMDQSKELKDAFHTAIDIFAEVNKKREEKAKKPGSFLEFLLKTLTEAIEKEEAAKAEDSKK